MSRTLVAALAGALLLSPLAAAPALAQTAAAAPTTASAETLLKKTIADIQAGKPDYDSMDPQLVTAMKAQPQASAQLAALGPVKSVARIGTGENPWAWAVTFETGMVLNWTLTLADGKIVGLSVQPAG